MIGSSISVDASIALSRIIPILRLKSIIFKLMLLTSSGISILIGIFISCARKIFAVIKPLISRTLRFSIPFNFIAFICKLSFIGTIFLLK